MRPKVIESPQQQRRLRFPTPMRPAALVAVVASACALAAAPAEAASTRFYGVVYDRDVMTASATVQDQQFTLMRKSGVKTVRRVFSWAEAQPAEGQPPDMTDTDALVARAAR